MSVTSMRAPDLFLDSENSFHGRYDTYRTTAQGETRVTAAIRARATATPDGLALAGDNGSRTWAQVAADLEQAAGALLAVAGGDDQRVSALGDNAIPTLEAHAAGLTVGVGTVATSRQLRAAE